VASPTTRRATPLRAQKDLCWTGHVERFGAKRQHLMKNADSALAAMNKYFVFNNLCGKAAGTVIFLNTLISA